MPAKINRILFDGRTADDYMNELTINKKERNGESFLLTSMMFEGEFVYRHKIYFIITAITKFSPQISLDTIIMGVSYQEGKWERITTIPRYKTDNPLVIHRKTLKSLLSLYLTQER